MNFEININLIFILNFLLSSTASPIEYVKYEVHHSEKDKFGFLDDLCNLKKYIIHGYIFIPGAKITQKYTEYHDEDNYGLISHYHGLTRTLYTDKNSMSIVHTRQGKRCFNEPVVDSTILSTFPKKYRQDFKKAIEYDDTLYGKVIVYEFSTDTFDRISNYRLYLRNDEAKLPLLFEINGLNIIHGSHYDFYQYIYTNFTKVNEIPESVFDDVKEECESFLIEKQMCRLKTSRKELNHFYLINSKGIHYSDKFFGFKNLHPYLRNKCDDQTLGKIMDLNEFDWREHDALSPIKDQSICGSCWSFGTTGAIEGAYYLNQTERIIISEQELIDCSWDQGNQGCHGGLEIYACNYMKKSGGLSTDHNYGHYIGNDGHCRENVEKTVKIEKCGYVESRNDVALKHALLKYGPITISIDASCIEFGMYKMGILNTTACGTSASNLDHSVLLVGYGIENGISYWIMKNSWSLLWGVDGYARIIMGDNDIGISTAPFYFQVTKAN